MNERTYYYPNEEGVYGWNANFRWEVSETSDLEANTTTLTIKFQNIGRMFGLSGLTGTTLGIEIEDANGDLHQAEVDGSIADSTSNWTYIRTAQGANSTITITIPHAPNGTGYFNGRFTDGWYAGRNYGGQWYEIDPSREFMGEKEFITIPRASSLNYVGGNIGEQNVININRASETFTHTITATIGNHIETIATKTTAGSVNWTPSTTLAQYDTTHQNIPMTMTLYTYSGNTLIGTTISQATLTIPTSISAPTITNISIKDINPASLELTGNNQTIIQQASVMSVSATFTARLYATLTTRNIINGQNVIDASSGTFSSPTSNQVIFTAIDSRGATTSINRTISNYIPYFKLSCSQSVDLPNAEGKTTIHIQGNCFTGSFGLVSNSLSLYYRKKEESGSWGSWVNITTPTITNNQYSKDVEITGLNYQKAYSFQVKAVDKIYTIETAIITVKSIPVFDWGKDDFNINGDLNVNGDITVNHNPLAQSILQTIYPVGTIYISMENTSPATLFGFGTWERIRDRFLLAGQSSTYPIGSTGGSATQTLTVNQLPSHTHNINVNVDFSVGDADGDGWSSIPANDLDWGGCGNAGYVEATADNTGGGQSFSIMPPYLSVFMWRRTA